MLKLRIIQPGHQDLHLEFDSDEAVLGRAPGCDVVVSHSCVSKRHAKLMAGIVLVDLGSSNGTTVEGRRIDAPVLLSGGNFQLGGESSDVRVEVEFESSELENSPPILRIREYLNTERQRAADLAAELAALREAPTEPPADPETLPLVQELRRESNDLKRRLQSLRQEVEARDVEASEGLQARLATEALATAKSSEEELRKRVAELESQAAGPTLKAAKQALAARVGELEADLVECHETIRRLRKQLETQTAEERPAQPAASSSELFFKLQAENQRLRTDLEEARSEPSSGSPDLFVSLQAENQDLRARIAELESTPAPTSSAPEEAGAELAEMKRENHDLRMTKTDLAAELELLRSKAQVTADAPPSLPSDSPLNDQVTELLSAVAAQDIDHSPVQLEGPLAAFVTLELFRFARKTERLVTRMTGGFLQLFDQHTMLPDTEGNLRGLLGELLVSSAPGESRQEFVAYVEELGRWLVVAISANRRAAERFAEELKSELSERNLTANNPIPKFKALAGKRDAELWQRAAKHLKRLTPDIIEERLEKLSSTCAADLRREQDR